MNILKLFTLFLVAILCVGCSNSSDEDTKISKQISVDAFQSLDGVSIGKYYLTKSYPSELTYVSCVYIPFPDKINSVACEASIMKDVSIPLLRLKEGSSDIVYFPSNAGIYANAEFSLQNGKGLNKEAEGLNIVVYDVYLDKSRNVYRFTSK